MQLALFLVSFFVLSHDTAVSFGLPGPSSSASRARQFRWNVEMKWYALIKNELTQHAANASAEFFWAADIEIGVLFVIWFIPCSFGVL